MAIEIVDFPSYKMVDLSMAKCESSPEDQRVWSIWNDMNIYKPINKIDIDIYIYIYIYGHITYNICILFIHSLKLFSHSFTHWFICSFIYPSISSFTHSFMQCFMTEGYLVGFDTLFEFNTCPKKSLSNPFDLPNSSYSHRSSHGYPLVLAI